MHVPELNRMGAKIDINGNVATIKGIENFHQQKLWQVI